MTLSKEVAALGDNTVATIDSAQTLKASKALLAHIKKASKQKAQESTKRNLLDDSDGEEAAEETPIWLTLTTKRHIVDKARLQPGKITLPHSLNTDASATICLITADPQRAYKDIVASEEFPAELGKRITRVVGFTKLKAKFSQYEAQRKLFSEHDVFLADERIINRLPKVLGKTFYKSHLKRPIPVVLAAKTVKVDGKKVKKADGDANAAKPAQIAKEVEKAIGSALVSLAPTTNTAVRIGYSGWEAEQIAENVEAVVESLVGKWVPQRWRNVRGIYIKGPETAALPVWLTDELWLDEKDVITNEDAAAAALASKEKANIGKKRKSITASEEVKEQEQEQEDEAPKKKKSKKVKENLPDGDDGQLNKQIADRKTKLKKQKATARKSLDA